MIPCTLTVTGVLEVFLKKRKGSYDHSTELACKIIIVTGSATVSFREFVYADNFLALQSRSIPQ